ncbi:MAG TPA: hypothetical protein V6D02_06650, partial [Candidatus Obscuribacterales bacterium]
LKTLANSLQFGLGTNPDNLAFTTGTVAQGLAYDEPDDVLHADGIRLDQVPAGITVYGFYPFNWFAWGGVNNGTGNTIYNQSTNKLDFPLIESFTDYHNMVPMTEYTIHQMIEDQVFAHGYLAAEAASASAQRMVDPLTGQAMQSASTIAADDWLTNYAAMDASFATTAAPTDNPFSLLEGAPVTEGDAIAPTAIGTASFTPTDDMAFDDGLSTVMGADPLGVDATPKPVPV